MSSERISREDARTIIQDLLRERRPVTDIRRIMYEDHKLSYSETNAILTKLGADLTVVSSSPNTGKSNIYKRKYMPQGRQQEGMSNSAIIGLVIMIIGILVTVISYASASNSSTGGTYVITWGAIVYGGIQFFRGLSDQ